MGMWSIFIPVKAAAGYLPLRYDPYAFNTIRLDVGASYERYSLNNPNYDREYSAVEQQYSLTFKGNILDPRVMIYDSDIFSRERTTQGDTEAGGDIWGYGFSSTILPKSLIPFSFYTRSTTDDTRGTGETITDEHGAKWSLKFRTLPHIGLRYDRSAVSSDSGGSETTSYGADISKGFSLWRAENSVGYHFFTADTEDKTSGTVSGYDSNRFTLNSNTRFSPETAFSAAATRYFIDRWSSGSTGDVSKDGTNASLKVSSKQGKAFSQDHAYRFAQTNEDDTTTTNQYYNGNIGYQPTRKLNISVGTSFNTSETISHTQTAEADNLYANAGMTYKITDHLSTSENLSYYRREETSGEPLTGKTERERMTATAGLGYSSTIFRQVWVSLGYYGGYFRERTLPEGGGEGYTESVYMALGGSEGIGRGIDFKYLTLRVDAGITADTSFKGYADSRTETVTVTANSKGLRYLNARSEFLNRNYDSWEDPYDQRETSVRNTVESAYFRNTRLGLYLNYSDITTGSAGQHTSLGRGLNINHSAVVWDGNLQLYADYGITEYSSAADVSETATTSYEGRYTKWITRNLGSTLNLKRVVNESDSSWSRRDTLKITLPYRLRAWFMSAEYDYMTTAASYYVEETVEQRVMLRIKRSFVRYF